MGPAARLAGTVPAHPALLRVAVLIPFSAAPAFYMLADGCSVLLILARDVSRFLTWNSKHTPPRREEGAPRSYLLSTSVNCVPKLMLGETARDLRCGVALFSARHEGPGWLSGGAYCPMLVRVLTPCFPIVPVYLARRCCSLPWRASPARLTVCTARERQIRLLT